MAKNKKDDPVAEILGVMFLMSLAGAYLLTKSIMFTVVVGVVYVSVLVAIRILKVANENSRIRASGIEEIDKMSGNQFEQYLAILFKDLQYKVKTTPTTGDFGADLILEKENRKIVVQAKCYSRTVGIKAVQEASSATRHYSANESWVVTNNFFSKSAIELSKSNDVQLIDRKKLIDLIIKSKEKTATKRAVF